MGNLIPSESSNGGQAFGAELVQSQGFNNTVTSRQSMDSVKGLADGVQEGSESVSRNAKKSAPGTFSSTFNNMLKPGRSQLAQKAENLQKQKEFPNTPQAAMSGGLMAP
mmetsp:Transcript_3089/g.4735  ORF Transcript_3089/g.4735 Transcript_3089/m.4735 type:complete len:109 (-) Transcript_3089:168-494(-)